MNISNLEIKKLYGLAAGQCSICKVSVFKNGVHIGQIAHIIARSTNGARGGESLSGDRDSYENLILLCANHHIEVDRNPSHYTVERLHNIKSEHEKSVSTFKLPKERDGDIRFLNTYMRFVPFTKLICFVGYLPASVKLDICTVGDRFEDARNDMPHLYPLNDKSLQGYFESFIESYYELWEVISGFTDVDDRQQANFSQADDRFYLHMERKYLPHEEITKLNRILDQRCLDFIASYRSLIAFIRGNYKEVDLNSYQPYEL